MEFLEPDFDPNKQTIAQLKSLLSQHSNIQLPMKAEKKQYYVDLFREHITAKAKTIRHRLESVQPSTTGILAVSKRGSPLPSTRANLADSALNVGDISKTPARGRKRLEDNSRTFSGVPPPPPPSSVERDNVFQSGGLKSSMVALVGSSEKVNFVQINLNT